MFPRTNPVHIPHSSKLIHCHISGYLLHLKYLSSNLISVSWIICVNWVERWDWCTVMGNWSMKTNDLGNWILPKDNSYSSSESDWCVVATVISKSLEKISLFLNIFCFELDIILPEKFFEIYFSYVWEVFSYNTWCQLWKQVVWKKWKFLQILKASFEDLGQISSKQFWAFLLVKQLFYSCIMFGGTVDTNHWG